MIRNIFAGKIFSHVFCILSLLYLALFLILKNILGYLSLNPLMYVWDQYVISADVPGYHEELIPVIGAIIFMILREQLLACRSVCNKSRIYFYSFDSYS